MSSEVRIWVAVLRLSLIYTWNIKSSPKVLRHNKRPTVIGLNLNSVEHLHSVVVIVGVFNTCESLTFRFVSSFRLALKLTIYKRFYCYYFRFSPRTREDEPVRKMEVFVRTIMRWKSLRFI